MRVQVQPRVLEWALESSGAPVDMQRRFPRLSEWLTGAAKPTLRQLEQFARLTSVPFGYLLLSEPPEQKLPIPRFRTHADRPTHQASRDLLETVHTMRRRQAWMREHLTEEGWQRLPFVGSASKTEEPGEIARRIAETLGLGAGWASQQRRWTAALRALEDKAEQAGILVAANGVVGNNTHRKLDVEEFRGFVLVDPYAPMLFVNGADAKAAQMFTLAHELAHVWLGSSAVFDLRDLQPAKDETEQVCNRVAAELLVPASELRGLWGSVRRGQDRFAALARRFKVSEIVAARRALDLGLITREEFFDFYKPYCQRARAKERGQGGGDFYATQGLRIGKRFGEAVVRAAREGRLLYRDAYRLTGLYGKTFERYAKSLSEPPP